MEKISSTTLHINNDEAKVRALSIDDGQAILELRGTSNNNDEDSSNADKTQHVSDTTKSAEVISSRSEKFDHASSKPHLEIDVPLVVTKLDDDDTAPVEQCDTIVLELDKVDGATNIKYETGNATEVIDMTGSDIEDSDEEKDKMNGTKASRMSKRKRLDNRPSDEDDTVPLSFSSGRRNGEIRSDQAVLLNEFQYNHSHSLRISVSNIAAMTGFHPWKNLPELLLMDLVYQGRLGQLLLQNDAKLIGLELVVEDEDAQLRDLAAKTKSKEVSDIVNQVLNVKKGKSILPTIQEAQALKDSLQAKTKKDTLLSAAENKLLHERVRHAIDTGYGTFHEDDALNLYEKQTGFNVDQRNAEIRIWPFGLVSPPTPDDQNELTSVQLIPCAVPIGSLHQNANNQKQRRSADENTEAVTLIEVLTNSMASTDSGEMHREDIVILDDDIPEQHNDTLPRDREISLLEPSERVTTSDDMTDRQINKSSEDVITIESSLRDSENPSSDLILSDQSREVHDGTANGSERGCIEHCNSTDNTALSLPADECRFPDAPFFCILGSIDGIRNELIIRNNNDADDDESWIMKSVIVECKHRMHRIQTPPALYEQIQCVAYCLMHGVDDADLVQVLRSKKHPKQVLPRIEAADNDNALSSITAHFPVQILNGDKIADVEEVVTSLETNAEPSRISVDNTKTYSQENTTNIVDLSGSAQDPHGESLTGLDVSDDRVSVDVDSACRIESDGARPNSIGRNVQSKKDLPRNETTKSDVVISISRISLDDPVFRHRQCWNDVILPRLTSFVQAAYTIRSNDDIRYRLLVAVAASDTDHAMMKQAYEILFEVCPWLKYCDTAYKS